MNCHQRRSYPGELQSDRNVMLVLVTKIISTQLADRKHMSLVDGSKFASIEVDI